MTSNYQTEFKFGTIGNLVTCRVCTNHIEFTNIHCPDCQAERYYNKTHPGVYKKW